MLSRLPILVLVGGALLLCAGCKVNIAPGVESIEDDKIPPMGKGAGVPTAGPSNPAEITSKHELNTFVLQHGAWNRKLAEVLASELKKRGVDTGSGPEVVVNVTEYQYNQMDVLVTIFQARLGVEVTVGEWSKRYTGDQTSPLSSTNAAWQAAGHALSQVMADPEFRKAIGVE